MQYVLCRLDAAAERRGGEQRGASDGRSPSPNPPYTRQIACSNMVRYLFSAGASASVLPIINRIGFGWTNTIMTVISYAGMACVIVTYKHGSTWRERANAKHGVTYREADEIRPDEDKVEEQVEPAQPSKDEKEKEDPRDQVGDLQRGMSMRRTPSKLPQPSALLSRTHSLTEAHHH